MGSLGMISNSVLCMSFRHNVCIVLSYLKMSNPEQQVRCLRGPPVELISDVQVQGFGAAWDPVQLAYCYDWPSILNGFGKVVFHGT